MPNDAKTGQPIFGHHASLYSRNRRPFALQNDDAVISKQTATTVTTVTAGDLADGLASATAGQNGYATGNARYLHLQMEDSDTAETLVLYAYNYAFGAWAQYWIPVGGGTTATGAHVLASFPGISGKKFITVPIHGVDRIGFTNAGAKGMVVRAATSTF